jgi:hypothetical protein
MPRYSQQLNDTFLESMDVGFNGFNDYLRPDQLQRGTLAVSKNGRLGRNGEWQVRQGVEVISEPLATGISALTLPFNLPTAGQIGDGTTAILNDSIVNGVYGSCEYSNPNQGSSEYIVLATNNKAVAVKISDGSSTDIAYPAFVNINAQTDMIQAFNKIFIFRDGNVALEWNGDLSGTPAFTKVESGTYSQPEMYHIQMTDVTSTDGLVSFVITGDVTSQLPESAFLRVYEADDALFQIAVDEEYLITSSVFAAGSTTVKAYLPVPDSSGASATNYITIGRQISVGNGFTHMPAPKFAIYHQRRLVMPFAHSVDAAADTYTSRGILDEVIASDVLDSDTYDQIYANFRFNAGTADYVVGLHSFSEDKLLVFNRNSIHLVQGAGATASSQLITNEVGCVARKTITQVGNNVIFLSDNGVYGANFQDLYNLRGNDTPLSSTITATIARINKDYWQNSVAIYYNNRYFIAVPIDNSDKNNAIIIFNLINKQWESVDTVNAAGWNISNLIVAGEGSSRGIYAVNDIGGIHKIDGRVDSLDRVITREDGVEQIVQVPAEATTRQFTMGVIDKKKWNNFELLIESSESNDSDFNIKGEIENVDSVVDLGTLSLLNNGVLPAGEDVAVRGRIGNKRGYGIQFTLDNVQGRPRFKGIKVSGAETFRSTITAV